MGEYAVKRQTTVATHVNVAADPGNDVAFVDGDRAELIVDMKSLTGTSVQADAVEVIDGGWTLPYDGQTANFVVGEDVTIYPVGSYRAPIKGTVLADADGGTTGTLTLKNVNHPEQITDNAVIAGAGGGRALVNSVTGGTPVKLFGGTWASITANGAGVFRAPFELPGGTGTDQDPVQPREFSIQYTFTTVTDADFTVDIAQSL